MPGRGPDGRRRAAGQRLARAFGAARRLAASPLQRLPSRWRRLALRWGGLPLPLPERRPPEAGRDLGPRELARLRRELQACVDGRRPGLPSGTLAAELSALYQGLSPRGRQQFVELLAHEFAVDQERVVAAARDVTAARGPYEREAAIRALQNTLEAPWLTILRQFNAAPAGTAVLIELRADLLRLARANDDLVPLEHDVRTLLASWFDLGFLELRRITWDSPASLLERLARSEAVHPVSGWEDLKNRLEPDRRVFAFFHPRLPGEPIVFVEVALTVGLAGAIGPLLDPGAPLGDPQRADTAIFYSISNAHAGLSGISFGGFLIKQVVDALAAELPRLRTFATLSPVPGFRAWLDGQLADRAGELLREHERRQLAALTYGAGDERELTELLAAPETPLRPESAAVVRPLLLRLCAEYLLSARRADDRALDRVANFHLSNGARVERLNWLADTSEQALRDSFGIMVNYLYALDEIDGNHEAYTRDGTIAASPAVTRLAREGKA
jgi:malonyl-CoA decarboxylase